MSKAESPLVQALRQAVRSAPEQAEFRIALSEALIQAGDSESAVVELGEALRLDPSSTQARELMLRALGGPGAPAGPADFNWDAAEEQLEDIAPPPRYAVAADGEREDPGDAEAHDVERPAVTLADVGGMSQVKDRLEIAFLAPMRNPELRKLYGKSLRGGLLLYGPPGCGKTFVARAVAGELGAAFVSVGIAEVLDMWIGNSERNLRELFQLARRKAPCVLFFDEVDALGQRRSQLRNNAMRTTVNQFLAELDSVDSDNDGVFVLGATNSPWDVDPALRRPGRFDRTVLVLPPDGPAREEILRYHLRDRPIAGIDIQALIKRTDGFSGADLAHLCESAAEIALLDSVRSGQVRMMGMPDFEPALKQVKPSTGPWFDSARSVALFANEGGVYDDLAEYLKTNKML
jgi:SpoVK/Ycf46/Vps4 family AAA+-type ATPase